MEKIANTKGTQKITFIKDAQKLGRIFKEYSVSPIPYTLAKTLAGKTVKVTNTETFTMKWYNISFYRSVPAEIVTQNLLNRYNYPEVCFDV